jgi:hypothetical protein
MTDAGARFKLKRAPVRSRVRVQRSPSKAAPAKCPDIDLVETGLGPERIDEDADEFVPHAPAFSAWALRPAMKPWVVQRARPCMLKPPADSPPQ